MSFIYQSVVQFVKLKSNWNSIPSSFYGYDKTIVAYGKDGGPVIPSLICQFCNLRASPYLTQSFVLNLRIRLLNATTMTS